jgi:N-methylhydantoinase A
VLGAFHRAHEAEYGHAHGDPIEVVNLRVTATGQRPRLRHVTPAAGDLDTATIGAQPAVWRVDGALAEIETVRLLRHRLPIDEPLPSPAIIFQRDTTIAVPPGWSAVASAAGPLMLTAEPAAPQAVAAGSAGEERA